MRFLHQKNNRVNNINLKVQEELPGEVVLYKSITTVVEENGSVHYSKEFFNSLPLPGKPPQYLVLKNESSITLLRNLNPPRFCNGTRLVVENLRSYNIEAILLSGCDKDEDAFISSIPLIPFDMPFQFKHTQIPVRLAFAM